VRKTIKFLQLIYKHKIALCFLSFSGVLVASSNVHAAGFVAELGNDVAQGIFTLIGGLANEAINMVGKFLGVFIEILQGVASYNGYAINQEVIIGWVIVRDVVNSFYIAVLIAIAIATVIRWKPLDFRTALPRLIISALIVNFSRTIALFGIEASTVLMNTFIKSIGDAWPGFVLGLRAPAVIATKAATLQAAGATAGNEVPVNFATLLLAQALAILMLVGAVAAIAMFVLILISRVILLWILIILSPLAFFLWGIPGKGVAYFTRWKDEYFKQLLIGPVMAFFMYLIILFFVTNLTNLTKANSKGEVSVYGFEMTNNTAAAATQIAQPSMLFAYILGMAMMFIAVEITRELGGRNFQALKAAKKGVSSTFRGGRALGRGLSRGLSAATAPARYGYTVRALKKEARGETTFRSMAQGIKSLKDAPAKRIKDLTEDAQIGLSKRASEAGGAGSRFKSTVFSLMSGNPEEVARKGIIGGLVKAGAQDAFGGGVPGQTTEALEQNYNQIDTLDRASKTISNLQNLSGAELDGMTVRDVDGARAELDSDAEKLDAEAQAITQAVAENPDQYAEYQQLSAIEQIDEADRTADEVETLEVMAGDYAEMKTKYENDGGQNLEAIQSEATETRAKSTELGQLKETVLEAGNSGGVNIDSDSVLSDAIGTIETSKKNRSEEKSEINKELSSRSESSARLGEKVDQRNRAKEAKIAKELFDKDQFKSAPTSDELTELAKSAMNSSSDQKLTVVMKKAADTGNLKGVMKGLGYGTDEASLKSFVKRLSDGDGGAPVMSKDRAHKMIQGFEARSLSEGKALEVGMVSSSGRRGKMTVSTTTQRTAAIAKVFDTKMETILKKGGPDGIGTRNEQTGAMELHEGSLQGIKANVGNFENLINKGNITIDKASLKMIHAKAQDIGISAGVVAKIEQRMR
jgi:hypothetical protein